MKTDSLELADEKNTDLADAILDDQIEHNFQRSYTLSNSKDVQFQGNSFIVTFAKGGSTARAHHVYESLHVHPDESIKDCVVDYVTKVPSRFVLSTLEDQRNALLAHLAIEQYSDAEKAKKLVIEWSGANDLITVDVKPTKIEAKKAVEARIQNVKEMFKNGYRQVVLFNLPDLSLTPRFQRMSEANKTNAHEVSEYFNHMLLEQSQNLQREYQVKYPDCKIEIFDVSNILREVCENPMQFPEYKFSSENRSKPYIESNDFKLKNKNLTSNPNKNDSATGYIFWDDVHPTATMHILLAELLMKKLQERFEFQMPSPVSAETLYKRFKNKYREMLESPGWFKFFRQSYLPKDLDGEEPEEAIVKILRHALIDDADRTVSVIKELGWIDDNGNIDLQIPVLHAASQELRFLKPIDRMSNNLRNKK
ncbi:MAG: SGNH/GDSL hydrolase family protein [Gammaproteobacteria bacterium]